MRKKHNLLISNIRRGTIKIKIGTCPQLAQNETMICSSYDVIELGSARTITVSSEETGSLS